MVDGTPPRVFDMLKYFEVTVLPLVESLDRWRCWRPVTAPTMVAILALCIISSTMFTFIAENS